MKTTFIQECISNDINVTLTLKANDLLEFGQYILKQSNKEVAEQKRLYEREAYYSVEEVLNALKIKNRSTLWRWQQAGYLVPIKVGKMLRYRKSDIENILNGKVTE